MENIWGILLQTVTVSLTAVLLLVLKWLMADKLSPRWQYGVWTVLALRMLVPVSMTRNIFGSLPLWTEIAKGRAESYLNSAYAGVYEPVSIDSVFPRIGGAPVSLTDWLFVIYGAGVCVSLMWYLVSYLRLRRLLKRGEPVSREMGLRIKRVCEKYGLKACKCVAVPGLPSAFVSGVFSPVLAVPGEEASAGVLTEGAMTYTAMPDGETVSADAVMCAARRTAGEENYDKILLHELLHLKYKDALQSIFWCVLRSLHWFNPVMQYVFDRIGNDMESLCDQRVLERLEGEERREYGQILLSMANERYARVPGTTSISNGGKNIARRIEAIVRFKKYPKGMALVSVCIVLMLVGPVLVGNAAGYSSWYQPRSRDDLSEAMAMARINRCETMAGAVDTYAKGLISENGIYIAMASPMEKHPELEERMLASAEDGWKSCHLDSGWELEYVNPRPYDVYNLKKRGEEEYEAVLAISVERFPAENGNGYRENENGEVIKMGTVLIPIKIWKTDGWVVEENGERQIIAQAGYLPYTIEPLWSISAQGETGTMTIRTVTRYETVSNSGNSLGSSNRRILDEEPVTDAGFSGQDWQEITYDISGKTRQNMPAEQVGMKVASLESADTEIRFSESWEGKVTDGSGKSIKVDYARKQVDEDWDGTLDIGGGGTRSLEELTIKMDEIYRAAVFWDGELAEIFELEVTGNE